MKLLDITEPAPHEMHDVLFIAEIQNISGYDFTELKEQLL